MIDGSVVERSLGLAAAATKGSLGVSTRGTNDDVSVERRANSHLNEPSRDFSSAKLGGSLS